MTIGVIVVLIVLVTTAVTARLALAGEPRQLSLEDLQETLFASRLLFPRQTLYVATREPVGFSRRDRPLWPDGAVLFPLVLALHSLLDPLQIIVRITSPSPRRPR